MTDHSLDPRITPFRKDLAAEQLRGTVNAPRFHKGQEYMVSAGVADMRGSRDAREQKGRQESQVIHGEVVTAYEVSGHTVWGQNATDGYVGYVPREALSPYVKQPTHWVDALHTLVYAEPTMKSQVIVRLPLTAEVRVCGEAVNGYLPLEWVGQTAPVYVYAQHLRALDDRATDFVATAERLKGTPYEWGGRTPAGIDCSGLLQAAFRAAGMKIPRDTDMQENAFGASVAIKDDIAPANLKRGDIVFFQGHVGIMTDHENILHANAFNMAVTEDRLRDVAQRSKDSGSGGITSVRRIENYASAEKRTETQKPATIVNRLLSKLKR